MLGILLAKTFKSGDGWLRCLGVGNEGGRMAWVWFDILLKGHGLLMIQSARWCA
jgi:hypothetical protein